MILDIYYQKIFFKHLFILLISKTYDNVRIKVIKNFTFVPLLPAPSPPPPQNKYKNIQYINKLKERKKKILIIKSFFCIFFGFSPYSSLNNQNIYNIRKTIKSLYLFIYFTQKVIHFPIFLL